MLQLVTKLENPSASLGDGSSKSGAKPNDGVSNSDVECEGKERAKPRVLCNNLIYFYKTGRIMACKWPEMSKNELLFLSKTSRIW